MKWRGRFDRRNGTMGEIRIPGAEKLVEAAV